MRHGCAGIARGRGQDGDWLVAADVGQHLRHKAAAKVFKRQRWAVEQLQAADVFLNLAHRGGEGKGRTHALLQQLLWDLIANKGGEDLCATADEILLQHLVDFGQVELGQIVREE